MRYSPLELPSLADPSSDVAVSPGLLLLSSSWLDVSSGDCDSEAGCSSVVVSGAVVNVGLCGACCESVVDGVSAAVAAVVIGSAAGAGSC